MIEIENKAQPNRRSRRWLGVIAGGTALLGTLVAGCSAAPSGKSPNTQKNPFSASQQQQIRTALHSLVGMLVPLPVFTNGLRPTLDGELCDFSMPVRVYDETVKPAQQGAIDIDVYTTQVAGDCPKKPAASNARRIEILVTLANSDTYGFAFDDDLSSDPPGAMAYGTNPQLGGKFYSFAPNSAALKSASDEAGGLILQANYLTDIADSTVSELRAATANVLQP